MTRPGCPGRRATLLALATPVLAGCDLRVPWRGIETAPPAAFSLASASPDPIDPAWWRGFGSAALDPLVLAARSANQDIAAAEARIRQADAELRVAGSFLLPRLDATGNARGTRRTASGGLSSTGRAYGANLVSSWELDFWGANRASRDAAGARGQATRYDRDAVALSIDVAVVSTFLDLAASRSRLEIARANLANAERVLALVEARVANGAATPLELAQQRTTVANQRATLPGFDLVARQAENALAVLAGRSAPGFALATPPLTSLVVPRIDPGLPSTLLLRRPDLAAREAQIAAAEGDITVARAAFYPSITLTALGGTESDSLLAVLNGSWVATLASGVTAPIFSGGRLSALLDRSRANRDELLALYRGSILQAFADVEDALAAAASGDLEISLREAAAESARTAFALAETQYREGAIDLLSLLESQRALFVADDQLLVARRDRLQTALALIRALGGGWQAPSLG